MRVEEPATELAAAGRFVPATQHESSRTPRHASPIDLHERQVQPTRQPGN